MSIKLVSKEIERFLSTSEPEVICIMGKWGVGKTFAWNQYLKNAVSKDKVALKRYAYVSLFGQNSMDDLKYTIFENTEPINQVLDISIENIDIEDAMGFLEKWSRKATNLISSVPKVKEYAPFLTRSFFLAVRNQIICIDDLERVGDGISIKNILGLISFLKEQRKCKIVLLLNDEKLDEQASKDFKAQLEKVVDTEMRFEPTPVEAAEIGIDVATSFHDKLSQTCIALGIVNIRVIRKIQRLLGRLEELLASHDKRVFEAAIPSIALFGWVVYQPDLAVSVDFIKSFNPYKHLFEKDKKEPEKEAEWRLQLAGINFTSFDELDSVLLESVEKGYFNPESIEKVATEYDKKLSYQDKDNSFHGAWNKYHGSFLNNGDEVLDEMEASFKKSVQVVSPQNLDGTLSLFRQMGRDKQADEMIDYYMKQRQEDRDFYDPHRSMFLNIKDTKLMKAFEEKLDTFKDNRNPKDILIKIAKSSGWNPEDITTLAKLSTEDFYKLFKENEGDDLRVIVSQSLKFARYNPSEIEMQMVASSAEKALKMIASESKMNRIRVLSYGITLEDEKVSLEEENQTELEQQTVVQP